MSWMANQPTDTTKIRNLGVVIRPNWAAIEKADPSLKPWAINLTNRTQLPTPTPDDPNVIEDSYIIYSKEETDGVAQLWGVDFNNNKSQLTGDFQLAQNGFIMLPPGLSFQWGQETMGAGQTNQRVTFQREFGAIPYSIVVTLYGTQPTGPNNGGNPATLQSRGFGVVAGTPTVDGFGAANWNSGMSTAAPFAWMAIGPL